MAFDLDLSDVTPAPPPEQGEAPPGGAPVATAEDDRGFLRRVFDVGLSAFLALLGREPTTASGNLPPTVDEPGGDTMEPLQQYVNDDGTWQRILTVEGRPSGDGRQFEAGILQWAGLPLPLTFQPPSHGGISTDGTIAGRIDEIWRDGENIWGRGVHDLHGPDGQEAHRLVKEGFLPGVSVDVDSVQDADVELVYPDAAVTDETAEADALIEQMFGAPELMIFHAGRIRGAALVTIPAFVEATMHHQPDAPVPEALAAAVADLEALQPKAKLPERLAEELAVVASLDGHRPPAEWFARCTDPLPVLTTADGRSYSPALGVSDAGRVWGYAATWGECHIGFGEANCVSPPEEDDFAHYLLGEVVCADGSRVPVGQITLGTGHAPLHHGARAAADHYDHTGSAVADVVVGADERGIWLAGAVRPGADVDALRAAGAVSGDWRRIGGALRLVALLAVNVPGFQQTRARVASGVPMALVAAGRVSGAYGSVPSDGPASPDLRAVADRIAQSVGLDLHSRQAVLAQRITAGRS